MIRLYIEKSSYEVKARFFRKQGMKIGERCQLNSIMFSNEPYLIEIGDDVAIANGVTFITHDGGIRCFNEFLEDDIFGKIKIGNNVLLGENSIILLNTTIGDNCIVGAGSVVRGTFPPNSVIVGNPAVKITNMSVQKLLYKNSPGRVPTARLSDAEKKPIVIKHMYPDNSGI